MDNLNDTKPLPELGNDAYKDVLASLSELDATGAIDIDYLEANKTRTFNFSTEIPDTEIQKAKKTFPKEHLFKIFCGIVLAVIFILLIIMASNL